MQYVHDDGVLLVFIPMMQNEPKKLSSQSFNYNFKVGHEPWTCVNLLRLANPRNFNNTVCLSILSFTIYFIFISECVLLYYIIIGFFILYYFYYICRQLISQHFCLFVLYNTFGWKRQPLSFRMNIDKDLSNNGWIWMTMFYTTSRMLNL